MTNHATSHQEINKSLDVQNSPPPSWPPRYFQSFHCSLAYSALACFRMGMSEIGARVIPSQANRSRPYSRHEPRGPNRRERGHSSPTRAHHIGVDSSNQ
jgi:hypothetical protein